MGKIGLVMGTWLCLWKESSYFDASEPITHNLTARHSSIIGSTNYLPPPLGILLREIKFPLTPDVKQGRNNEMPAWLSGTMNNKSTWMAAMNLTISYIFRDKLYWATIIRHWDRNHWNNQNHRCPEVLQNGWVKYLVYIKLAILEVRILIFTVTIN